MLPLDIDAQIRAWLLEDIGPGDITTQATVSPDAHGIGRIRAKQALTLSGLDLVAPVFSALGGAEVRLHAKDGDAVAPGTVVAEVYGAFSRLLTGERLALNLLMRLSGVATLTAAAVAAAGPTKVLDTRKTTPGLRWLEKRAVRHGGGVNHRHHLGDGILIKDNHIVAAGGVKAAVEAAKKHAHHLLKIELEVAKLDQIEDAISAGAHVLLLDNMDDATLQAAVKQIAGRAITEASGNMSLERLRAIKNFGLDFVSMGALTHSAIAADLSMKIERVAG